MKTQGSTSVFRVENLEASLRHYREILGFEEVFRFEHYAGLKLGEVTLHLTDHSIYPRPIGGGAVYIYCDEVDSYHEQIARNGAEVKATPENRPYGMRDFTVMDPDGNLVHFGCEVHPSQPE